jgi:histidinol-phosphate phosphatase family protein
MEKRSVKLNDYRIEKNWTLFLDRDGVINKRIEDDYVLRWGDFEFLPGVIAAIKVFTDIFGKIIIVTNQQCIDKGLLKVADLDMIHKNMLNEIEKAGGKIDAVFYAQQVKERMHVDRKPNVGMALKAKKKFPSIDFKKSVMAGDSLSDMEFGHRLGMVSVLINEDATLAKEYPDLIRFWARDLEGLVSQLK